MVEKQFQELLNQFNLKDNKNLEFLISDLYLLFTVGRSNKINKIEEQFSYIVIENDIYDGQFKTISKYTDLNGISLSIYHLEDKLLQDKQFFDKLSQIVQQLFKFLICLKNYILEIKETNSEIIYFIQILRICRLLNEIYFDKLSFQSNIIENVINIILYKDENQFQNYEVELLNYCNIFNLTDQQKMIFNLQSNKNDIFIHFDGYEGIKAMYDTNKRIFICNYIASKQNKPLEDLHKDINFNFNKIYLSDINDKNEFFETIQFKDMTENDKQITKSLYETQLDSKSIISDDDKVFYPHFEYNTKHINKECIQQPVSYDNLSIDSISFLFNQCDYILINNPVDELAQDLVTSILNRYYLLIDKYQMFQIKFMNLRSMIEINKTEYCMRAMEQTQQIMRNQSFTNEQKTFNTDIMYKINIPIRYTTLRNMANMYIKRNQLLNASNLLDKFMMFNDCANLIQRAGRQTECKIYIHNKFLKEIIKYDELNKLLDSKSIEEQSKSIELNSLSNEVLCILADCMNNEPSLYLFVLQRDPLNGRAKRSLGIIYQFKKEYDTALTYLIESTEINTQYEIVFRYIIDIQMQKQEYANSLNQCKKIMTINNKDFILQTNIAQCYLKLDKKIEALYFYRLSLSCDNCDKRVQDNILAIAQECNCLTMILLVLLKLAKDITLKVNPNDLNRIGVMIIDNESCVDISQGKEVKSNAKKQQYQFRSLINAILNNNDNTFMMAVKQRVVILNIIIAFEIEMENIVDLEFQIEKQLDQVNLIQEEGKEQYMKNIHKQINLIREIKVNINLKERINLVIKKAKELYNLND